MQNTPPEVIAANVAFIVFWILVVAIVWLVGQRWERTRAFRERMIAQWKPALVITVVALVSMVIAGRSPLNPYLLAIFCQALIGLAIARGIPGYEPLKTTQAVLRRNGILRNIVLLVGIGVVAGVVGLLIGSVGMSIARSIFGEVARTSELRQSFAVDKVQAFFQILWGAGIAEETTYRLVALSFVWSLTRRRWLAIVISALLFAGYHLSPLDGMYLEFWQFPMSQFLATTLIGMVWGYIFTRRDFETTVLSHTMSDGIAVLLFM
jgi:membrane protease YdiL (CAAX protease family)